MVTEALYLYVVNCESSIGLDQIRNTYLPKFHLKYRQLLTLVGFEPRLKSL